MTTYFLSYARADEAIALRLADDLIAAGVSLWVDRYHIRPDQSWDQAGATAARGCEGMLVVLSPRSAASPTVLQDVAAGVDGGKAVITMTIEPCQPPPRLSGLPFIDAASDYQAALRQCLAAVVARRDSPPEPSGDRAAELVRISDEALDVITLALTRHMGPIVATLVAREGQYAQSPEDLCLRLSQRISADAERRAFLSEVSAR